jgi:hypothetical protein
MIRFLLFLTFYFGVVVKCQDDLQEAKTCRPLNDEASNTILLITPQENYLYDR